MEHHLFEIEKRNITLQSHRTSLAMERCVWSAFEDIAFEIALDLPSLMSKLYMHKGEAPFAQTIRLFCLLYYQEMTKSWPLSQTYHDFGHPLPQPDDAKAALPLAEAAHHHAQACYHRVLRQLARALDHSPSIGGNDSLS